MKMVRQFIAAILYPPKLMTAVLSFIFLASVVQKSVQGFDILFCLRIAVGDILSIVALKLLIMGVTGMFSGAGESGTSQRIVFALFVIPTLILCLYLLFPYMYFLVHGQR